MLQQTYAGHLSIASMPVGADDEKTPENRHPDVIAITELTYRPQYVHAQSKTLG